MNGGGSRSTANDIPNERDFDVFEAGWMAENTRFPEREKEREKERERERERDIETRMYAQRLSI
jgi:hypothetical protein